MNKKRNMTFGLVDKFVKKLFAEEFHHKQIMSMELLELGVLYADRLGDGAAIGTGLAKARGTAPKHGIKQFDRFLIRTRPIPSKSVRIHCSGKAGRY